MNPITLYILAYLSDLGETWTEAPESTIGHIMLTNAAGERMTFERHFNGGDPQWFPRLTPMRLRDALDGLYPLRSPPKRDT